MGIYLLMFLLLNLKIMPRFDKTGPAGQGPATGRGLGLCRWSVSKFRRRFR